MGMWAQRGEGIMLSESSQSANDEECRGQAHKGKTMHYDFYNECLFFMLLNTRQHYTSIRVGYMLESGCLQNPTCTKPLGINYWISRDCVCFPPLIILTILWEPKSFSCNILNLPLVTDLCNPLRTLLQLSFQALYTLHFYYTILWTPE
jgi:hypothetical protein